MAPSQQPQSAAQEPVGVRCGERFSTYPELFGRALRASRGLSELGVGAGDRVALLLRNSIEFLEASIATVPLGASAVPINWHWRSEEVAHVLEDSAAKVLIVHADLLAALPAQLGEQLALVVVPVEDPGPRPTHWSGSNGWPGTSPGRRRPRARPRASSTPPGPRASPRASCALPSPMSNGRPRGRCSMRSSSSRPRSAR